MDITRRSDYACRILRAAYQGAENYVSVSDIAEQEDIPYAFARSIQHDLVKSGLVTTTRGARGGLKLNCDPEKTTLLEVLNAVQGPVSVAVCVEDDSCCDKRSTCAYFQVWRGADRLLQDYLGAITLDALFRLGIDHPVIKSALGGNAASCVSKEVKPKGASSKPAEVKEPEKSKSQAEAKEPKQSKSQAVAKEPA